jgi:hypothetical protein
LLHRPVPPDHPRRPPSGRLAVPETQRTPKTRIGGGKHWPKKRHSDGRGPPKRKAVTQVPVPQLRDRASRVPAGSSHNGAAPERPPASRPVGASSRSEPASRGGKGSRGTSARRRPAGCRWTSGGTLRWTAGRTTLRSSLGEDDRLDGPHRPAGSHQRRSHHRPNEPGTCGSAPKTGEGRGNEPRPLPHPGPQFRAPGAPSAREPNGASTTSGPGAPTASRRPTGSRR